MAVSSQQVTAVSSDKNGPVCSEEKPLTAQGERRQVYGQVVLLAAQFAGMALQVVSVTRVLGHPVHLVPTVGLRRHPRGAALRIQTIFRKAPVIKQLREYTYVCVCARYLPNVCLRDR